MKQKHLFYSFLFIPIILSLVTAVVVAVPQTPHSFHGELTIEGNGNVIEAPAEVEVIAKVNDEVKGSKITENPGHYGEPYPDVSRLLVQGNISEGATINFFVEGKDTGQTYSFSSGEITELDLSITDSTPPSTPNLQSPGDVAYFNQAEIDFSWGSSSDALAGLSHYEFILDGEIVEPQLESTSVSRELNEGRHTWSIKAVDRLDNSVESEQRDIIVDFTDPELPSLDDVSVNVGEEFTLSAKDVTDNTKLDSINWDFGDGETATGEEVSHTYSSTGTYEVTLIAKDRAGNTNQTTLTVDVSPEPEPEPEPTPSEPIAEAGGPYDVKEGNSITLNGEQSYDPEGSSLTYEWSIQNDPSNQAELLNQETATPTLVAPEKIDSESITIKAQLTITNEEGLSSSDTATITVYSPGKKEIEEIGPNESSEIEFENLTVTKIRINANETIKDALIGVNTLKSPPSGVRPIYSCYRYLEIEPRNIYDQQIKDARIEFNVPKTWLKKQNTEKENVIMLKHVQSDWKQLETSFVREEGDRVFFEAVCYGFSYFSVASTESNIEITDISVDPQEIYENESISLSANLINKGNASGTIELKRTLNDEIKETRQIELDPGESTSEKFEFTIKTAGNYEIGLNNLSTTIEVKEKSKAIELIKITAPNQVQINESFETNLTFLNPFDSEQQIEVSILENGELISNESLNVLPGQDTKTINLIAQELGETIYKIENMTKTINVTETINKELFIELLTPKDELTTEKDIKLQVSTENESIKSQIVINSDQKINTDNNGTATIQFEETGRKTIKAIKETISTENKEINYENTSITINIQEPPAPYPTWTVPVIAFTLLAIALVITYYFRKK